MLNMNSVFCNMVLPPDMRLPLSIYLHYGCPRHYNTLHPSRTISCAYLNTASWAELCFIWK